jgi:hypothetical protein
MRRWHWRYKEYGYDGLLDRRLGKPSPKRVPLAVARGGRPCNLLGGWISLNFPCLPIARSFPLRPGSCNAALTMRKKRTRLKIAVVFAILALYVAVLVRGSTESTRRELQLRDETVAPDRIAVSVLVTNVDPVTQELTAQLGFRLAGNISRDEVTPAADMTLLINNVRGQQEFDFPRGKRMNRIEAVFPLNGNLNKYPFDRYETTMWLLMTLPPVINKVQVSKAPENRSQETLHADQLAVGAVTLQQSTAIPLSLVASAAIPGIKFQGSVTRNDSTQVTGIVMNLRRADNLIAVSILINAMMAGLAVSVLAMVLQVTTAKRQFDLLPFSMSMTLIFGLPALRNVQPGVPPVGAYTDYVVFIWAELIVAVSAVVTVWHWLLRAHPHSES